MKLFAIALVPLLATAAILPDSIGAYHRTAVSQPTLNGRDLWDEYGLHDYESAVYENGAAKFTATAYQLQDSTGAMAAFNWQRPANAKLPARRIMPRRRSPGSPWCAGTICLFSRAISPTRRNCPR